VNPNFKNTMIVILAIVVGMIAMMLGHRVSNVVLPPPDGMEVSNMESFIANVGKSFVVQNS
jgi:hypothetical protein